MLNTTANANMGQSEPGGAATRVDGGIENWW
jgi:hypothetical protein